MLLVGLAIFAIAAIQGVWVNDPGALIAVRAAMGLGAAAIMPSTLSIITTVFPAGEREKAVSIWAGVAGGSALLGLLVSAALFVFWRAPRKVVTAEEEPALDRRVLQSLERG